MAQSKIRTGLVGLGGVAQAHLAGCAAADGIALVAGSDLNAQACEQASSEYSIRAYRDYRDMLEREALDAVFVLTPPSVHRRIVEDAAARGLHILCEKPISASIEDAMAIRAAVHAAGVVFQYGASYRHLPSMIAARKLVSLGEIGVPRICMETLIGGAGAARADILPASHYPDGGPGGGGMGLVDHGIHMIDAFAWLTGARYVSAFGSGNIAGCELRPEFAVLRLDNGVTGHILIDEATYTVSLPAEGMFSATDAWNLSGSVAKGAWDPQPCLISVYGSTGALRIYPYANVLLHASDKGLKNVALPIMAEPNHFRQQAESFARAILNEGPLAACVDDGIVALEVLLAVYRSAAEHRWVNLAHANGS